MKLKDLLSLAATLLSCAAAAWRAADAQPPALAQSGPSSTGPENLLTVNFPGAVEPVRVEAAQLLERIHGNLEQARQTPTVELYESAALDLLRLNALARQLIAYGEPLGKDLQQRELLLNERLRQEAKAAAAADSTLAGDPWAIRYWFYKRTPYYDSRASVYPVGLIDDRRILETLSLR